jgi:hypothetical protein
VDPEQGGSCLAMVTAQLCRGFLLFGVPVLIIAAVTRDRSLPLRWLNG